jgi:formylglycine-generating enzyme required for sulfatase activity
VEDSGNPKRVEVLCGWYCDTCLPRLEAAITAVFPEVVAVSIGHDRSPYPPPDVRFIRVSDATAYFEDGSTVRPPPYEICRSPVTTGQFEQFTVATGYLTDCEREENHSFRFDETIEPIRKKDRANIPVHSVSFNDASAYCLWANVRLPTEAELLAAALIDQRVMNSQEWDGFMFGNSRRFQIENYPNALEGLGTEFVAGGPPDKAIVRGGPFYARETGWESERNRDELPRSAYDMMIGFRVCRIATSAPLP